MIVAKTSSQPEQGTGKIPLRFWVDVDSPSHSVVFSLDSIMLIYYNNISNSI